MIRVEEPERTFALLAECQKETQDAAMWQRGGMDYLASSLR